MDLNLRLPSYAELFGALDFKVGDEARSVYSPAAYLADLLQLLEDSFGDASLAHVDRRKDIYAVLLDADNTFTERPYLDIVNQILVSAIYQILHQDDEQVSTDHKQAAVYANLRESRAPFQLPFDLDNEQLKLYLHYLNTSAEPIYKHFALEPDYDTLARQYLGLSQAVYQIITSPLSDESELKACYGLVDAKSWTELTEAASFMRASSLTAKSLRELLFQNLAEGALDPESGQPERTQAASFFINDQLGGYVSLDADEERLLWSDGSASILSQYDQ